MDMGNASSISQEDWIVHCSDDELKITSDSNLWEPSPQEIANLYEVLDNNGIFDLEWQCLGRRSPTVHSTKSDFLEKEPVSDDEINKQVEPNEFDFDEFSTENSSPQIARRKRISNASSTQKRVARLDKVMYDIQRHRKLDELELQQASLNNMQTNSPNSTINTTEGKL